MLVTILNKIAYYLFLLTLPWQATVYGLIKCPWVGLLMLTMLNTVTTFPIIFNFFVAPGIEKEIHQKLNFMLSIILPTWYVRQCEIAYYVITKYITMKVANKPEEWLADSRWFKPLALHKVNYSVEKMPKKYKFICLIKCLNDLYMLICYVLIYFRILH